METDSHKIEGHWRRNADEASALPWPIPDRTWAPREAFVRALDRIEKQAQERSAMMDYMGYSTYRLCGKTNGASEFQFAGWIWPEGYRHYIADHFVRPSPEFEQFVWSRATRHGAKLDT
jgi:hypothetical protein